MRLYREEDRGRVYFYMGAAYYAGAALGGVRGIFRSVRETRGKPNGMAYFFFKSADELGRKAALASLSACVAQYALKELPKYMK